MSRRQREKLKRKGARLLEKGEFIQDLAVPVLDVSTEASRGCLTNLHTYKRCY